MNEVPYVKSGFLRLLRYQVRILLRIIPYTIHLRRTGHLGRAFKTSRIYKQFLICFLWRYSPILRPAPQSSSRSARSPHFAIAQPFFQDNKVELHNMRVDRQLLS